MFHTPFAVRSLLAWAIVLLVSLTASPAVAQTVTATAMAPSPDPVAVGVMATASLDATATPPSVSPGCGLTGPTWSWTLSGGGGGISINQQSPNSPLATIRTSATATPPGIYPVTATATATWTSTCGTFSASGTTNAVTFRVVGVQSLLYQRNGTFVPVTGTLYVLSGKSVTFKALPNPAVTPFPAGQPVWSGSSGATGTGDTKTVTFGALSARSDDFKTVVATCGTSSQTANVIVFDFTPVLTPVDNFAGRDLDAWGVCEKINLKCQIVPSGVMEYDIGGLQWVLVSGGGTVTGGAGGTSTYRCPDVAATITLKVVITGGPMLDEKKDAPAKAVVPPTETSVKQKPESDIYHKNPGDNKWCSVGFCGVLYAKSDKVVSFKEIRVREGDGKVKADGYWLLLNDNDHAVSGWISLKDLAVGKGYEWDLDFAQRKYDKIFNEWDAAFAVGTLKWPIKHQYKDKDKDETVDATVVKEIGIASHECEATAMGKATIRKAGSGDFSRDPADAQKIPANWNNDN